jgi:hypothetical protein
MLSLFSNFDVTKYSLEDFKGALETFKKTKEFPLHHPPLIICVETLTKAMLKELGDQIPVEDIMKAMFANGLLIGLITAEQKLKEDEHCEMECPENRVLH